MKITNIVKITTLMIVQCAEYNHIQCMDFFVNYVC